MRTLSQAFPILNLSWPWPRCHLAGQDPHFLMTLTANERVLKLPAYRLIERAGTPRDGLHVTLPSLLMEVQPLPAAQLPPSPCYLPGSGPPALRFLPGESVASMTSPTLPPCWSLEGNGRQGPFLKAPGEHKCPNVNKRGQQSGGHVRVFFTDAYYASIAVASS